MATVRKLPNSKVCKKQSTIKTKTFSTLKLAEEWGSELDAQISLILNIKPKQLLKLSLSKVEAFGGLELFSKLGIELKFITFKELVAEYSEQ